MPKDVIGFGWPDQRCARWAFCSKSQVEPISMFANYPKAASSLFFPGNLVVLTQFIGKSVVFPISYATKSFVRKRFFKTNGEENDG